MIYIIILSCSMHVFFNFRVEALFTGTYGEQNSVRILNNSLWSRVKESFSSKRGGMLGTGSGKRANSSRKVVPIRSLVMHTPNTGGAEG